MVLLGVVVALGRFRGTADACLAGLRAAVIVAVAGGSAWWCELAGGCCQPVAAGSALSLSNAAMSSVTQGHVSWRWSFARRPENASRPATCSSR